MLVVLPAARIMFAAAGKDARHMINSQRQTTMSVCPSCVCVCACVPVCVCVAVVQGKYKYLCGNSRRFVKIFVELRQETAASHRATNLWFDFSSRAVRTNCLQLKLFVCILLSVSVCACSASQINIVLSHLAGKEFCCGHWVPRRPGDTVHIGLRVVCLWPGSSSLHCSLSLLPSALCPLPFVLWPWQLRLVTKRG